MNTRRFSFVRHGKVDGPAALYGKTNIALSACGHQELLTSIEHLHQADPIDFIISSSLKRCALAAKDFAAHHLLPIALNTELQECNFGDWDGIDFNQLQNQWHALEEFWQSPITTKPPNGEELPLFFSRISKAWNNIQTQQFYNHTLILCHGGTIRMVIADILKIPLESPLFQQLHIDYCSHTSIEINTHMDAKPSIRWIGASL